MTTQHERMSEGIDSRMFFAVAASARITNVALIFAVPIYLIVVGRPWISPIATVMITSDEKEDGSIWVDIKTYNGQSPVVCSSGAQSQGAATIGSTNSARGPTVDRIGNLGLWQWPGVFARRKRQHLQRVK
jgi:hypothetical protein